MHANPSLLNLLLIYGLLLLSQSSYMVKATDGFSGLSTNELKLVSRFRGRSPPPAPKPHVPLHFLPRPMETPRRHHHRSGCGPQQRHHSHVLRLIR
ncbi:unnamed protein product [Prunus armeniaca]|uniref:Uncharacterized protein n=1 Tax=Prunus armeniaca TaxID=36596 RepID=A0A6J5X7Q5_PRUAR|nr:unnamed protein product [Prunus armeniaca]